MSESNANRSKFWEVLAKLHVWGLFRLQLRVRFGGTA